jgi:hypothetical protein
LGPLLAVWELRATIGYVGLPKLGKNGEAFVRVQKLLVSPTRRVVFLSKQILVLAAYLDHVEMTNAIS